MKLIRGMAGSLVIAIAGLMFVSTASSQLQIRVNPEHRSRDRDHVVYHPRSRAHVRPNVQVRRRDTRPDVGQRDHNRHQEIHRNQ